MKALEFISPSVIDRLETGTFVPTRRSAADKSIRDRRDIISPLAVTRQCVRYEPNVFSHRRDTILQMATMLNHPWQKIILLGGPQGSGKTSLLRGLIELMGGKETYDAQLLWFEANRHSDFEEVIQFLIQYITYVCSAAGKVAPATHFILPDEVAPAPVGLPAEPIRRLETLIRQVQHMPLLLVLDNAEYLVDAELRFNSYPFKELLNFLLAFPNIKLILAGERLPYADMSPNQNGVHDIQLPGLETGKVVQWLQAKDRQPHEPEAADASVLEQAAAPESEQEAMRHIIGKVHGYPWPLKLCVYLHQKAALSFLALNRMLEKAPSVPENKPGTPSMPVRILVGCLQKNLSEEQTIVLHTLSMIRHPVNAKHLQALIAVSFPAPGIPVPSLETLEDCLEHSWLKPLLKVSYPPQEVLENIRNRKGKNKPWYELYHQVKRAVYERIPQQERAHIHTALQDFYLREKGHDPAQRVLDLKNRALLAEARHHGNTARSRKTFNTDLKLEAHETVDSKAYLYRHAGPSASPKRPSLEDYRHLSLPEDAAEITLDGPGVMEWESADTAKPFNEHLAEISLSETEKALLMEEESPEEEAPAPASEPAPSQELPLVNKSTETGTVSDSALDALPPQDEEQDDEQARQIQKRLSAAVVSQDKAGMTRELLELARHRAAHGRYEAASQCLEKAYSLKADVSKEALAEIYRLSGIIHKETYRHNLALSELTKAANQIKRLMFEDETVDPIWLTRLGQVYQHLGDIQAYRHQYEPAADAFHQALRWYHSADDEAKEAETHFQLAGVYEDMEETERAIAHYEKALRLDERNRNLLSAAASLVNLGHLHYETGRFPEALDYLQRSLAYDRELENIDGQLSTLELITSTHLRTEEWEKARDTAQQALSIAIREGLDLWKATFYMKLGQLAESAEDWSQALKHYEAARTSGEHELAADSLHWIEEKIMQARRSIHA